MTLGRHYYFRSFILAAHRLSERKPGLAEQPVDDALHIFFHCPHLEPASSQMRYRVDALLGEVGGKLSKVTAPASTPASSEKQPGSSGKYITCGGLNHANGGNSPNTPPRMTRACAGAS